MGRKIYHFASISSLNTIFDYIIKRDGGKGLEFMKGLTLNIVNILHQRVLSDEKIPIATRHHVLKMMIELLQNVYSLNGFHNCLKEYWELCLRLSQYFDHNKSRSTTDKITMILTGIVLLANVHNEDECNADPSIKSIQDSLYKKLIGDSLKGKKDRRIYDMLLNRLEDMPYYEKFCNFPKIKEHLKTIKSFLNNKITNHSL